MGQTDRYFLASSFALTGEASGSSSMLGGSGDLVVPGGVNGFDAGFGLGERVEPWAVYAGDSSARTLDLSGPTRYARLMLRGYSGVYEVDAGEELVLDFGVYLGPLDASSMAPDEHPLIEAVNLVGAIEYNLGGFAACCTFPWLGQILLGVLRFFHGFTFDWAVAIVLLVLLVRCCTRSRRRAR
jgi:hypothetical protein